MADDGIEVKITGDDSGFQAALDRIESGLSDWGLNLDTLYKKGDEFFKGFGVDIDQFASKIGTTGPIVAATAGVAVVAFEGLKKAIEATTEEFAEDETAELKFNAAISANSTMTEGANDRLKELAETTALLTGKTTSSVETTIAMLSASGRTEEQIKKMITAAEGLSVATGVDLQTALTQINATFAGSAGKLEKMTPALGDLSKTELENGAAVDVLNEKYGKYAATLGGSSEVSMSNYKNQIGELKSALGGMFEESIKPIRDMATSVIEYLVKNKDEIIGVIKGVGVALVVIGTTLGIVSGAFTTAAVAAGAFAVAAAPIAAIAVGVLAVGVAIYKVVEAVGGWKVAFLEVEKIGLQVLKNILDGASDFVNSFTSVINLALKAYNAIPGTKKVELLATVDYSQVTGLNKEIDNTTAAIAREKAKRGENADQARLEALAKSEGEKLSHAAATQAISDSSSQLDWDKKLTDQHIKNLETQESADISAAQKRKATVAEVVAIAKSYDDQELAYYKKSIEAQEADDIASAQKKKASADEIKEIQNYYAAQITEYEKKQVDERTKLDISYTKTLQDDADKKATYEKEWAEKATKSSQDLASKQSTTSDTTTKTILANLQKEEQAEIDKAKAMGASESTIANIHQTYANERVQAEKDAQQKIAENVQKTTQTIGSYYSQISSAISSYISASAEAAEKTIDNEIKAIEASVSDVEKSIVTSLGGTSSQLTTMYDTLTTLGNTEAATNIQNQQKKAAAVESYESLSEDQIEQLLAASKAAGNAEVTAELEAAQKVVQAKADAAAKEAELEKKKSELAYNAAHANWVMNIANAVASAAQAIIVGFAQLGPVAGAVAAGITAVTTGISLAAMKASEPQRASYATGTDYSIGGLALVGETGPEYVQLPQGSKVANSYTTSNMHSKTISNTINITAGANTSAAEIARQLKRTSRQLAFQGVL